MTLTLNEKIETITRGVDECIGDDFNELLGDILKKRDLKVYWGTATTGVPHYGYLIPLLKIKDLLLAGSKVCILIADLHALLDAQKSEYSQLESRSEFYEKLIKILIGKLGIKDEILENNLEFVRGRSFQLNKDYMLDKLKLEGKVRISKALRASSEVVKQQQDPEIGSLTYPLMQNLDEIYLDVDMQIGGRDQRKIFMLARTTLPMLGHKKRLHMLTKMLSGIHKPREGETEVKMSSSNRASKIDFFDTNADIKKKLKNAFAVPGDVKNSPFLETFDLIVFPISQKITIKRKEKFGGDLTINSFEELVNLYEKEKIHPLDLKLCLADYLGDLLSDVRTEILEGSLKDAFIAGYPKIAKEIKLIK